MTDIKQHIEVDLKAAMLGGNKTLVETLRGIKAALLLEEVAKGKRDTGLTDDEVTAILQKEVKKRQESADLFGQGGNTEKQAAELTEKAVIEAYLPAAITEEEITAAVEAKLQELKVENMQAMGQVIGAVKLQLGAAADGAIIARVVKERLQK